MYGGTSASHFSELVNSVGYLVDLDVSMRDMLRLNYARVLITTVSNQTICSSLRVKIDGAICLVRMEEENVLFINHCGCRDGVESSPLVDVEVKGSEIELDIGSMMSECSDDLAKEDEQSHQSPRQAVHMEETTVQNSLGIAHFIPLMESMTPIASVNDRNNTSCIEGNGVPNTEEAWRFKK